MSARSVNPGTARLPGEVQEICYQVVSAPRTIPKRPLMRDLSVASGSCDFKRALDHRL